MVNALFNILLVLCKLYEFSHSAEGLSEGCAEGCAEGRNEGLAEGRAEERMANAMSLKANGAPIDIIAKILGLTEDEVARL